MKNKNKTLVMEAPSVAGGDFIRVKSLFASHCSMGKHLQIAIVLCRDFSNGFFFFLATNCTGDAAMRKRIGFTTVADFYSLFE